MNRFLLQINTKKEYISVYLAKYILICLLSTFSSSAFSVDDFSLPNNQWRMISLPANPGANNTVRAVFGDDIAPADYGRDNKWTLYSYNTKLNRYDPLELDTPLEQGKGYWMIQVTGESVTLDMPKGSSDTPQEYSIKLTSSQGNGSPQWNLAGYPFSDSRKLGNFFVKSSDGVCSNPACDIDQAETEKLLHNQVWTYDGQKYIPKSRDKKLNPWEGFWVPTLEKSYGHTLVLTSSDSDEHQIPILSKQEIQRFLALINDARSVARTCGSRGDFSSVPALTWSDKLYKASYEHSQDLAISKTFSHTGSGTASDWTGFKLNKPSTMIERLASYDYNWSAIAENIAAGNETAESTVQQWLNSSGHCANIMSPNHTEIEMAKMTDLNAPYKHYWTQNFGKPR